MSFKIHRLISKENKMMPIQSSREILQIYRFKQVNIVKILFQMELKKIKLKNINIQFLKLKNAISTQIKFQNINHCKNPLFLAFLKII